MKKTLLFILIITFWHNTCFSQNNKPIQLTTSKTSTELLEKLSPFTDKTKISYEDILFPLEYVKTYDILGNTEFLKVYHKGKIGYVPLSDFDVSEEILNEIRKINSDKINFNEFISIENENAETERLKAEKIAIKKDSLLKQIKITEQKLKEEEERIFRELLKEYEKKGIVITNKEYSYKSYSDQFGLQLEFYNGYDKEIKYIDLTIRPYNRVGDLTKDDLGRDVNRLQLIGPLKSKSFSQTNTDDLFWDENDVIEYLVITYMKITFMDNSIKEVKSIKDHLAKGVYNGKGQ